jgi:predicted metal-dependent hydrolase
MSSDTPDYEPRYLAGVVLFNRRDFFEAHEVWEDLWLSPEVGADRRFVQGLIQSAVALHHFRNGNRRGARKLYGTARAYMEAYPSPHLGLDTGGFWLDMEHCFEPLLTAEPERADAALDGARIPTIRLNPPPAAWPNPEPFLAEEH